MPRRRHRARRGFLGRIQARPGAFIADLVALAIVAGFARFCLRQSRKGPQRD